MKTTLTIEESARLIELGIDPKLASKWEIVDATDENDPNSFLDYEEYPIFDLSDILSILPKEIKEGTPANDMTIAKQLALVLAKEIIAEKKQRRVVPDYALLGEINERVSQALDQLVADGALVERQASVNRNPAYECPAL